MISYVHRDAVRYCFGPLIQAELKEFTKWWNNHSMRESKFATAPGGTPELLYHMPHIFESQDYLCDIVVNLLGQIEIDVCEEPQLCSPIFKNFADAVTRDFAAPTNAAQASHLYFYIVEVIEKFNV